MNSVMLLYDIVQILLLLLLGWPVLYLLIFAMAGLFYRPSGQSPVRQFRSIAVLIPAYKEDAVIVEVARDALLQHYPKALFEVVVIADSLQAETLSNLKQPGITVIEVQFEQSTKTKALNSAMARLGDHFDLAVILDADNLMEKDFLRKMNESMEDSLTALQGHRVAKNLGAPLALLDAVSEEINNHIFRQGHRAMGMPAAIIGSGMAFRYGFFKELMSGVQAVGGFDKEIELKLLRQGQKIGYREDAYVYDEKIQKASAFTRQRRRWLSAQFNYLKSDIGPALKALITRGNIGYFDKVLQFMLPPRILLLGAMLGCVALFPLLNVFLEKSILYNYLWAAAGVLCLLVFVLSVPRKFYTWDTLRAMARLPQGMFLMLISLMRISGANREFLHTAHHGSTTGVPSFIPGKNQMP